MPKQNVAESTSCAEVIGQPQQWEPQPAAAVDLPKSEERYRVLFNSGNDAVFVHAPFNSGVPGKFLEVNDTACRRLGYSREKLLQMSWQDIHPPEMNAELPGHLARLETQGKAVWEGELIAKDGWRMPVEIHAHQFELGGQPMVLSEAHDLTERKQAEMALRESEGLYHSLVRHLPCGIFQKDASGRYVYINDRFYEQGGLTPDLILGRTPAEFEQAMLAKPNPGVNRHMAMQCVELAMRGTADHHQIMQTGQTIVREAILYLPDHTAKYFQIFKSPILDTDGRIIGSQGIQFDITEQKRSELALRESEHHYRSLFANMIEGLAYCRVQFAGEALQDLVFVTVNDAFTVLTGLKDVVNHKISEVVPGILESDRKLMERFGQVARTGKPERFELYVTTLKMWMSLSVYSPLKDHIMVVFDVITERKQAEEQLRKLSQAVEQSPVSIIITDPDGNIEYVNSKFISVSGYSLAEVLGQNPRVLKSGANQVELYQNLWSTIQSGQDWQGELCNQKKNGELFWESVRISPITAANGAISHFLAVKEDITAHKKLEQEFRQAQKMEAFGRLAAGVAHDFNNMMTSVLCGAELLRMGGPLAAAQKDAVTEITNAAKRATALTRQLLLFSRRQAVHLKVLELNDVVENMGKMLRRLIGEDISLQTHYGPGGSPVLADSGMLDQVLMNLAVNSRDAMPKGGDLLIQTATLKITHPAGRQRPGSFVRLSISDSGCGIAPADMEHIFEPFFTTKEVGKGTGLGLATVFGIVEQHKGWIEVESQLGRGTTFHIYLPRQEGASGTSAVPSATARERGGKETILLVEDDSSVRAIAREILTQYGYRILEAASGAEALEQWKQRQAEIDLLFTDVVMPGHMSGFELGQQLAKDKPDLKVVYTSGYTDEMLNESSTSRQTKNFVEKPYSPEVLLRKIRAALDSQFSA